jgi:SAM-dependent methyltransferase
MHPASKEFMEWTKKVFPQNFKNCHVLDVGSQDINGNNRYLFEDCNYTGLDLGSGPNVDVISHVGCFYSDVQFDTIISTNAFEHDSRYLDSIAAIVLRLLKPKGLFAFSCASIGTPEHGTTEQHAGHSPHTNDHYKNLTEDDIKEAINFDDNFEIYGFHVHGVDLRFWGIKKYEN